MPRLTGDLAPQIPEEVRKRGVELYAQFTPVTDILKILKKEFGLTVPYHTIYTTIQAKKWQPLLARTRQQWVDGLMEMPLAHKRGRVAELTRLFNSAERDPDTKAWQKRREQLHILRELREEMDEAKTHFTVNTITQINQFSDEDLVQRREEVLRLIKDIKIHKEESNGVGHREQVVEASVREGEVAGEQREIGGEHLGEQPESRNGQDEHWAVPGDGQPKHGEVNATQA